MDIQFMECYDQLSDCVLELQTESFKLRLLSDFLSNVDGLPDSLGGFFGSFSQTADFIQQHSDDLCSLVDSLFHIVTDAKDEDGNGLLPAVVLNPA